MPKHTNIYGLYDPQKLVDGDLDSIRYVGKADDMLVRLQDHISAALRDRDSKIPVHHWIRKLDKEGVEPQMLVLRRVPMESWQKEERSMIATLRAAGHDLLNATEGGEGLSSEEAKRLHANPEFKKKHAAAMSVVANRPEVKAKKSAAGKRYYKDPAARAKHLAALNRPEVKAKLSAPRRATVAAMQRPEVKAKMSAPRPKMSVAWNRPEVKAKMSAGLKEAWADPNYRAKRKIMRLRRKVVKSMLRRYGA